MTLLIDEAFDGPPGVALDTTNTTASLYLGAGSSVFEAAHIAAGTSSGKFTTAAGLRQAQWGSVAASNGYFSFYVSPSAVPGSNVTLLLLGTTSTIGSTVCAVVYMAGTGKMKLGNATYVTQGTVTTDSLVVNELNRVDLSYVAGALTMAVYPGNAQAGNAAGTATAGNSQTGTTTVKTYSWRSLGHGGPNSTFTSNFDAFREDDTALPGPVGGAPTVVVAAADLGAAAVLTVGALTVGAASSADLGAPGVLLAAATVVTGPVTYLAGAALQGAGGLTVGGSRTVAAAAALTAPAALVVVGRAGVAVAAQLSSPGRLTASTGATTGTATIYRRSGTTLVPVTMQRRSGSTLGPVQLGVRTGATITYVGGAPAGPPAQTGSASLQGAGRLTAGAAVSGPGSAAFRAAGRLTATGTSSTPVGAGADWRGNPLLRPVAGTIVMGVSPTVGTTAQWEAIWGRPIRLQRVYGGTTASLPALLSTCQSLLNAGIVPALDFNSPATYAAAGFPMTNVAGTGQTMWAAQGSGYFDAGRTAAASFSGQAYIGFDDLLNGLKALTAGACPTNQIILTKDHEMENADEGGGNGKVVGTAAHVAAGTQAEFRAAWRHFAARMTALSVTNLLLGFNFASGTSTWGTTMTDTGSSGFYPGHDCVDIVGWDPYNSAGVRDTTWREFSNMINKFGQLTWWNANFALDGADTLAASSNGRVYKPACLFEFGTTDSYTNASGVTSTAETWATNMATYLQDPAVNGAVRWLIYFNNSVNTILTNPSYRYTGFTGVGRGALWAGADPLLP